jgi:ribosomal protein S18 acetylase RimI-like enzyme
VPVPDHVLRFWRALDALVADVRPTPWGAVVLDARSPQLWDTNYARLDRPVPVDAADLERELLPALATVGVEVEHIVTFHHEVHAVLLAELSSRGHRIGWDAVMDLPPSTDPAAAATGPVVEELSPGEELWGAVVASFHVFGIEPGDAIGQLLRIERDLLAPGGKRWFGVRSDDGRVVSLGALLLLEGTGYVDNVATMPEGRGRGRASAITRRIATEARSAGGQHVFLLADPDEPAVLRLYGRLGFREVGRLASTRGPVPGAPAQPTNL